MTWSAPLILLASAMSLGITVTLLAWIASSIVSWGREGREERLTSKSVTRSASAASCRAWMAVAWNLARASRNGEAVTKNDDSDED